MLTTGSCTVAALLLAALAACGCSGRLAVLSLGTRSQANVQPRQQFVSTLSKAEDSIEVLPAERGVVFRITNPSGAGEAEIELRTGNWPSEMSLEFTRSSGYLEYLLISNGATTLRAALGPGPTTVLRYTAAGTLGADERAAAHVIVLARDEQQRNVTVTLPSRFAGPRTKSLRIEWIDAFR